MYYAKLVYPNNGYDCDIEKAKKLDAQQLYKVDYISIGQSHSSFSIEDIGGCFNTVQFEFFNDKLEKIDIFKTEYNTYI